MTAYDPWQDLRANWPEVRVALAPLGGRLLGELRYPLITLRAGTSAAQRRCTLAHELVHLERGVRECGPWAQREERLIEREVARRLIPLPALVTALRNVGTEDRAALAAALDVDTQTLRTRLDQLSAEERRSVETALCAELWTVP
jgi:Zn-dependent peptidase ImmA (M78 family)